MKTLIRLLIFVAIVSTACTQGNSDLTQSNTQDSIRKTIDKRLADKQAQAEFEQQQIKDSLRIESALKNILETLNAQKIKDPYKSNADSLNINFGHIFSNTIKHLFVKQNLQTGISINIFKFTNDSFINVYKRVEWSMTYVNDTVRDVNGDNTKDFLFHWYPLSGCCPRDIYDVYLQKPNGDFTEKYEFINPDFSSKEKVIRGLRYGHFAPLYKYRWNKFSLDTIEYIYFPDSTSGNKYVRRKHENINEHGQKLNDLPSEYKSIGYGND